MQTTRNANNTKQRTRVPTWALVSVSCVALAAGALTFTTGVVHADALLSGARSTPATSTTPVADDAAKANNTAQALHGMASWYGPKFNGRETASGERFDMNAMTAAQPELPFGTRVRVENLTNHKSVVVRINDRGYLPHKRVLDLSYGAARKLGMAKEGIAQVAITVLPDRAAK